MRKVKLTINGVPFGRPMHKEVALVYIENLKYSITGLHFETVKRCRH